jgi:hypothetical protein
MAVTAIAALLGTVEYVQKGVAQMTWGATISGVGNSFDAPHLPEKTLFISPPTSAGGTSRVIIEGSNVSTVTGAINVFTTLTSPTDGQLDFSAIPAAGIIRVIRENPRVIRPRFETVTAGEDLQVMIVAR